MFILNFQIIYYNYLCLLINLNRKLEKFNYRLTTDCNLKITNGCILHTFTMP